MPRVDPNPPAGWGPKQPTQQIEVPDWPALPRVPVITDRTPEPDSRPRIYPPGPPPLTVDDPMRVKFITALVRSS